MTDEKNNLKVIELNDGTKMPILGLGTWLPKNDSSSLKEIILHALDLGYRYIDTAQVYNTEGICGEAINEWIKKTGTPREQIFITTKLWNTFHEKERIEPACLRSLKKLNLEYIDMFLIHTPTAFLYQGDEIELGGKSINLTHPIEDTWKGMEELVKKGYCKNIGVSNFNKRQLERILKIATIKPAVNQIESSIIFPNQKLIDFCESNGIKIQAYSPLGNPSMFKEKESLLENELVKEIATKLKKTPGQICLAFNVQRNLCILPKSVSKERIKENSEIFDFQISENDMKRLVENIKPKRMVDLQEFFGFHAETPFLDEF